MAEEWAWLMVENLADATVAWKVATWDVPMVVLMVEVTGIYLAILTAACSDCAMVASKVESLAVWMVAMRVSAMVVRLVVPRVACSVGLLVAAMVKLSVLAKVAYWVGMLDISMVESKVA